jgi:hypothetical protein
MGTRALMSVSPSAAVALPALVAYSFALASGSPVLQTAIHEYSNKRTVAIAFSVFYIALDIGGVLSGQLVSKPDLHRSSWDVSCADLRLLDSVKGRSGWQIAFAPLVALEERLRPGDRPAAAMLVGSPASGVGVVYRPDGGTCVFVPTVCGPAAPECEKNIELVECPPRETEPHSP